MCQKMRKKKHQKPARRTREQAITVGACKKSKIKRTRETWVRKKGR